MTQAPPADTEQREPAGPATGIEVAVVSGLSGAGRSTAAKCLEDLGWFVVDNLPPELIATMVDLGSRARGGLTRIAVVLDVRSRAFTEDLAEVIRDLDSNGYPVRLLYLEASDAALIRRYEANRRQHPLQAGGRISDGLAAERNLLGPLRDEADVIIDTSDISVHELRDRIEKEFTAGPRSSTLTLLSFGYKYGLPLDADLVVDMRFLPNPFWIPELRDKTGLDQEVRDYVLTQEGAAEFLDQYIGLLDLVGAGYQREGKRYLTVAIGCTGGKHRSVAVAEELGRRLRDNRLTAGRPSGGHPDVQLDVQVAHRDLGRE